MGEVDTKRRDPTGDYVPTPANSSRAQSANAASRSERDFSRVNSNLSGVGVSEASHVTSPKTSGRRHNGPEYKAVWKLV